MDAVSLINMDTKKIPTILILTPYTPLKQHHHAADDIGLNFLKELSKSANIHVYAPGQGQTVMDYGITYHKSLPPIDSSRRFFGFYPAGLRKDWSRVNTIEARSLIKKLGPDNVHVEYLQPIEAVLGYPGLKWSVSFHDISEIVYRQRITSSSFPVKIYRLLEYLRVRRIERKTLRLASRIFTLSERDSDIIRKSNTHVSVLKLGLELREESWRSQQLEANTILFSGAMWRDVNFLAAIDLIRNTMPLIWLQVPGAKLRIVGARPPTQLRELSVDSRIEITGEVEDLDVEYRNASLVVATSIVDAGILLKALRALACGCPLVTNSTVAEPIGLVNFETALVGDTSSEIAECVVKILRNPEIATRIATNGLDFSKRTFSWKNYTSTFLDQIGKL